MTPSLRSRLIHKWLFLCTLSLIGCGQTVWAQSPQVLMQGWYWDYPKTANGYSWADTLTNKAVALKNAGITHIWFPPHAVASFGTNSNGYDPKDYFIGNQTTGLGTRPALNTMLQAFSSAGITPVADMIYNHRDGGRPEVNTPVKNYVTSIFDGTNGSNPYPSDRFRCALPIGAGTNNGARTYYVKVSSKTASSNYVGKAYQAFFWTGKRGSAVQSTINETKPNGGGDCGQGSQVTALNQVVNSAIPSSGCGTVEFAVTVTASDFNAAADSLYMSFINPNGNYGDQRVYGIWNGSQDVASQLLYQTYTDFTNMTSTPTGTITIGGSSVNVNGNYNNFKPNDNNAAAGGLTGDSDSMPFFYDYDQNQTSTINLLNNWTYWNYETLGVRGLRMDAVKNFPAGYVSQLMNNLQSSNRIPNLVVGEFWDGAGNIKTWLDNVRNGMTTAAQSAIQVKAFDFPLRYALRDACDDANNNVRSIFFSGLRANSVSGFNVVTFVNNHDFRDNSGGNSLIRSNPNLAYAYILTNNQLGVPTIFYPDYYGYPAASNGQYGYHPTGLPAYKTEIDRLLNVLKTYINGSTGVSYLNSYGGTGNGPGSNASFSSGNYNRCLIYQLSGVGAAGGKDVIVAINFDSSPLRVNHKIAIQNTVTQGTRFGDVLGRSSFPYAVVNNDAGITNSIYIDLPARSYSVWVQDAPPLPVTLRYFNGRMTQAGALLGWATAREDNNAFFQIERSHDPTGAPSRQDLAFESIATIPSQATGGNSTQQLTYSFTDTQPLPGINYYRLTQTDLNGQRTLHKIIALNRETTEPVLYPNPVSATEEVVIEPALSHRGYTLSDVRGRVVQQSEVSGVLSQFSLAGLPAGVYLLKVQTPTGPTTFRLLK